MTTAPKGLPHLRDVSNWQGAVDWKRERGEVVALYTKVSQGMTFTDPDARGRIREGTRARFYRLGGYHFATPGVGTPEAQAERLLRLAPLGVGRLRPCLDAEWNDLHLSSAQLAAWYLGFVLHVYGRTGYYPVVYGSPAFLQPWSVYHPEVFGRCPLWLASYGVARPSVPAPWSSWAAWQWTASATDAAIPGGRVDDSFVADLEVMLIPRTAKAVAACVRYGGFRRFAK